MMTQLGDIQLEIACGIDGWMSPTELEFLAKQALKSNIIIEVGCYLGRSTRAMADNTGGMIFAVDPWNDEYYNDNDELINILGTNSFDRFFDNLRDHIRYGTVDVHRCKFEKFPDFGYGYADFIFIDGDHRYQSVVNDINKARKLIRKNGIIAGHDYTHTDWPGVKQAVDEIFPNAQIEDSIWFVRL